MILDTSAILAVLGREPEAARIGRAVLNSAVRRVSAASLVEAGIVVQARFGDDGARDLDLLVAKLALTIEPVTARQSELARRAFRHFGKGRHPAGLNFGDCFAYALAKETGEPLLFKGDDFSRTDIAAVSY
jgi:ribonuclease VapC